MHPLAETLLDEPVIAAVKTDDALTAALASPCSTVFLLASTLLNVGELVRRIHAAGKLAVVHIDLVDGLSAREVAVNSLIALCHPDGIISTHPSLIRRARHQGLLTIQRAFIPDSLSLNNLSGQLEQGKPDFVEILPGIMPRVITEISTRTRVPVIAGGLLRDKADVMAAMRAGASAVSTSAPGCGTSEPRKHKMPDRCRWRSGILWKTTALRVALPDKIFGVQGAGGVEHGNDHDAHVGKDGCPHAGHTDGTQQQAGKLDRQREHDVLVHDAQGAAGDAHGQCDLGRVIVHQHHVGGLDGGV